jgi:hypothetical protein
MTYDLCALTWHKSAVPSMKRVVQPLVFPARQQDSNNVIDFVTKLLQFRVGITFFLLC